METEFHQERVSAIADRYRKRGYQVVQEPNPSQLPSFLQGFRPDILAQNAAESVVVEIKSYGQVTRSQELENLAKSIESHPGWRMELVFSNPPEQTASEAPSINSQNPTIGIPEIESRIASSKQLASIGETQSAIILLWSALEATLRIGLERIPASFINNSSAAIIKQGVAYGLMDQKDSDFLSQLLPARNAAAHGFSNSVDDEILKEATQLTVSILSEVKVMMPVQEN